MTRWLASVTTGSASSVPVRFCVGDTVDVLLACGLPKFERVQHTGRVERVTEREGLETLYWIAGVPCARTARVLRLVSRAAVTCYLCDGDGFSTDGGNCSRCGGSGREA